VNKVTPGFRRGIGQWSGTAEVYDGQGRFVGNAADRRTVTQISETRTRIDLAFLGPLMLTGYYEIENQDGYRLYQGPANVGYAETLDEGLVDANNYWQHWGLNQRFFLYVTPDQQMQMSLALLSRGEKLVYTIIGEYYRLPEDHESALPFVVPDALKIPGIPQDRQADPTAGRGTHLLHRQGSWRGECITLDHDGSRIGTRVVEQLVRQDADSNQVVQVNGCAFADERYTIRLHTNQWESWTGADRVVGSFSIAGGRAQSGQFHHTGHGLRVWKREVVSADGAHKFMLYVYFRGSVRVGVQYGLLNFEE
jgi:hypothetical protein